MVVEIPAQILLSKAQVEKIAEIVEEGEAHGGVVLTESHISNNALDVWVLDESSMVSTNHRSVIIDREGTIIGDSIMPD